ncbi:MAG TPA: peptidyl-prolyl cis-trans isomerase [Kofleriaceae bacterium]|nr:peptidyl-prolyl cis-trans isomerase [Kofleriaceae bacterium]
MLDQRSAFLGAAAGFAIASILGIGFVGCHRSKSKDDKTDVTPGPGQRRALPPQSPDELAAPIAKVDDIVITIGELQERINRQSPYIRQRYTSLEQKREFLDNLIRFEVMAKEAFKRGFDKDPDVVRTMKQVMIQKLMKDQFENTLKPEDITDAEMKVFYEQHKDEYNKPEEVRVSAIVLKSKAQAAKVAKEALGEPGSSNKGFRELVTKYSTDDKTKIRGGDLRYFAMDTMEVPKAVVEAAFKLGKTGDVAGPITAGNQHYIIKQTGKRKAITKSFESVKRQIQNRLYRDKRTDSQKAFITGLRQSAKIEVFEGNLAKIRIDTSTSSVGGHGGHDLPAMIPEGAPAAPDQHQPDPHQDSE